MKVWKIAVLGSGIIGSTIAYSLFLRCPNIEIVLINRDERKSWAKAADISHCAPELANQSICSARINECFDADVMVITAGSLPKENGTRSDVLKENLEIFKNLLPAISKNNPNAIIVNITNPVDAMTYAAQKLTGFPTERIIGTGTELDSMRLRSLTAKKYNLLPKNLLIDIVGEHGDTMVPVWSSALYDRKPFTETVKNFGEEARNDLRKRTIGAGWNIRQAGEHSCYAISFSATRIIENILGISDRKLLISTRLNGEYGIYDVYMSLPAKLGSHGVEKIFLHSLTDNEVADLKLSSENVKRQMNAVDKLLL